MWDHNLGVHACKKISNHLDIGGIYLLHKPIEAVSCYND